MRKHESVGSNHLRACNATKISQSHWRWHMCSQNTERTIRDSVGLTGLELWRDVGKECCLVGS
jgi:hypothetical protein